MKIEWNAVADRSNPNLNVISLNGAEAGFIYKPKDSATDKNAWRCHSGIGESNKFLGHAWSKVGAKAIVEQAVLPSTPWAVR